MKPRALLYALLGGSGLAAAVLVPVLLLRGGSGAVPGWAAAASPGPLSAAHAFLGEQCEACHVPLRGPEPTPCLTCHAADAPQLVTRPATAFHAGIGTCAGCHVEHLGRERRPILMDHAVLARSGHARAAAEGTPTNGFRHALDQLRLLLGAGVADLSQDVGRQGRSLPAAEAARLDCAGCHTYQDPHRGLLGRGCQACHVTRAWSVPGYRHPSPRSEDCVQCHQAPPSHYMMHFEMMDRGITGQMHARVEQCFLCHQTDSWNNIRGLGWYKHH